METKLNLRKHQHLVTATDIKRFIQATGDDSNIDRYIDKASHKFIAPPLFCQSMSFDDVALSELDDDYSPIEISVDVPAEKTVGGASQYEFFQYIWEGDVITVVSQLLSVEKKQGKSGTLYLVAVETCFQNQFGEQVAREVATYVKR